MEIDDDIAMDMDFSRTNLTANKMKYHKLNIFLILSEHDDGNNISTALAAFWQIKKEKRNLNLMFFKIKPLNALNLSDTPLESIKPTWIDVLLFEILLERIRDAEEDEELLLWSSALTSYHHIIDEKNELKQLILRTIKAIHLSDLSRESMTKLFTTEYELPRLNKKCNDDLISNTPTVSNTILECSENLLRLQRKEMPMRIGFGMFLNHSSDDNSAQRYTEIGKIISFSSSHKAIESYNGLTLFVYRTMQKDKIFSLIFYKLGNHRKK